MTGSTDRNCLRENGGMFFPELTEAQQQEVGEFLQELDEHDDVHRVWAAVK